MTEELKPCPFCGDTPKIEGKTYIYWIECCHYDFNEFDTMEDIVRAWNTRAEDAPDKESDMDTSDLRKMAKCVYLATDELIAKEISETLTWAADKIDRLNAPDKEKACPECEQNFADGMNFCAFCGRRLL